MKKYMLLLPLSFVLVLALVSVSFAGLINYDRVQRRKTGESPARPSAPSSPARPAAPAVDTRPMWMRQAQPATTPTEKKYDTNRDGLLQTAEVKIFLRDVIQVVDSKGGYNVDSNLLREYDKNRDGLISRTEIILVKTDANK